ncbi:hypothetical protein ACH36K_14450 [Clostridium sp. MB05]|uniref:hypothetical protein n=1 Tax=Clostridium sp. MB05 TaxID=3376682 RepID=UPI0039820B93
MKNIDKALKISITLIVISFLISLLILSKLNLDKPVFLKNYKEVEIIENEGSLSTSGYDIELKYISNREDKRKVSSITFKEEPKLNFYASENNSGGLMRFYNYSNDNIENHGRYGVHTVFLNLNSQNYGYDLSNNIVLSEATITFNDGLTIDVDLGKIILYKNDRNEGHLTSMADINDTSGVSKKGIFVSEYIRVSNVYSSLFSEIGEFFNFNINKVGNLDSRDTIYNGNENLYFTYKFSDISDISMKLYSYDIKPVIYFKDRNEKEYKKRIDNIMYNPNFSFYDIYKYLRVKGEI